MSRRSSRMPGALTETAFSISRGLSLDIGYGRLRGRDLQRPFHGVRANGVDLTQLRERCRALTVVFESHHAVSHLSGAELLGMPLPQDASADDPIEVVSLRGRDGMRRRGVTGRSTRLDLPTRRTSGVRVVAPADIWCQLADPRIQPITPEPVDSVRETFLRLALTAGGLPEPVVQPKVATAMGDRHADLGYRDARLLLEYLGDAHRTSRRRWLEDLTRVQLFKDAGWDVMMIGAADLEPDPAPLVERVRRALARRHPRS
ncbi:MAG TPA: hypothetical protein VFN24_09390 [Microbacterium sp.]|nr:hypothetical protein [Microbacterium sp.]